MKAVGICRSDVHYLQRVRNLSRAAYRHKPRSRDGSGHHTQHRTGPVLRLSRKVLHELLHDEASEDDAEPWLRGGVLT